MSNPSTKITIQADDQASSTIRKVAGEAENLGATVEAAGNRAAKAFALFGGGLLGGGLIKSFRDTIRDEGLSVSLHAIGENAGYSASSLDQYTSSLRQAGLTSGEALGSLTKMIQSGVSLKDTLNLSRVAQDAAASSNRSYSDSLDAVLNGLRSGQAETLRSLGLNVDFKESYRALAEQLGVKTKSLTEAQKQQARFNAVMEAGEKQAGSYSASLNTTTGKIGLLGDALSDLSTDFGAMASDVGLASGAVDGLTMLVQGWSGAFVALSGAMDGIPFGEMMEAMQGGNLQGGRDLIREMQELEKLLPDLHKELDLLSQSYSGDDAGLFAQELQKLEAQFASGEIALSSYLRELRSLAVMVKSQLGIGAVNIAPDISGDMRGQLDSLLENVNSGLLKKTKKNRLAGLDDEFDPQIAALREATQQWRKGTEEYALAQDALNAVIAEKGRQRAAIIGKEADKVKKEEERQQKAQEQQQKRQYDAANREIQQFNKLYTNTFKGSQAALAGITAQMNSYREAAVTAFGAGSISGAEYAEVLERIEQLQFRLLEEASTTWTDGIARGLRKVSEEAGNMAKNMESVVAGSFNAMGQAFSLTTEGMKFNWRSMLDSMLNQAFQAMAINPLISALSGGLGSALGGGLGSLFGGKTAIAGYESVASPLASLGFSAKGNVFSGSGISAHSNTVVNNPTMFSYGRHFAAFAKGAGIMGEAGPEAIMPLTRTSSGDLGVRAVAGSGVSVQMIVNIENNAPAQVEARQSTDAGGMPRLDILINPIKESIASDITSGRGPVGKAISRTYGMNRANALYNS